MNKIDKLLEELCPEGVNFVKLGEVCDIKTGKGITKADAIQGGIFPIISGGKSPMGYFHSWNRQANTVTISRVGAYAGFVNYIEEKFYLNDKCFSVIPLIRNISSRFLFYVLKGMEEKIKSLQSEGGVPTINTSKVGSIEIPLLPLEVQNEIVGILDRFADLAASLQAELQAELQARIQQYEYYRNKLLSFNEIGGMQDVIWMKMSDIGSVCMCKRIMKNQTNTTSGVPFYKIGTFGKVADAYISNELYEYYKNKYSYPKKGDILMSASGTIGKTVIFDGKPSYFQDSNIVWINNDESKALNKYLYYYYQIIDWKTEGGTIKRLYNNNLSKTEIPIPSLSEQERIVEILDRFERLTADLQTGLPAEIKARQQQYEYYRNRLLTFKRKTA